MPWSKWTSEHGSLGVSRAADIVKALEGTPGGWAVSGKSGAAGKGGSAMASLTVVSGGDAAFADSAGRSLSLVNGRVRGDLPGVEYDYPDPAGGQPRATTFFAPPGEAIRRTVTATSSAPYTYAVLTTGGSAVVTARPGRRSIDGMVVVAGVTSVSLTPERAERACSLGLSRFVDGQVRDMTVAPEGLRGGDTFTVATADADQAVRITNNGPARSYAVTLSSPGQPGRFQSARLTIGAGKTQTVKAYDWDDLGGSRVELFAGPAGAGATALTGGTLLREGSGGPGAFASWVLWAVIGAAGVAALLVVAFLVLRRRRRTV